MSRRLSVPLFVVAVFASLLVMAAGSVTAFAAQGVPVPTSPAGPSPLAKTYWDARGVWVEGRPPVQTRAFHSCKRFALRLYKKRTGKRVRIVSINQFASYEQNRFQMKGMVRILDGSRTNFRPFHCRTKGARVVWFR